MLEKLKDILRVANPRSRVWPSRRGDPCVRGPQPKILSHEAALELQRRREMQADDVPMEVRREGD